MSMEESYNLNDYFPLNRSTMSDPYILRDLEVRTSFLPFSYNAISKELRIYNEIIVKIKFNNDTYINEISSVKATRDVILMGFTIIHS